MKKLFSLFIVSLLIISGINLGLVEANNQISQKPTSDLFVNSCISYIVAFKENGNILTFSNIVTVNPIQNDLKPSLFLSPELNRKEYYPDDDIMIKMQIMNKSNRGANDVKLTMTLPQDIKYVKYVKDGQLMVTISGNSVTFEMGQIGGMSTTTFDIYCKVKSNIRNEKSAVIIFDVNCKEESTYRKEVQVLIKLKRGENRPLYLGIYLRNIKVDPDTGEFYIDFDTSLELILRINGGNVPYTLKIDWGDGSSKEEKKVDADEINLTHKFESRGTIEIKFEVIDSVGRSKKATFKLKVK